MNANFQKWLAESLNTLKAQNLYKQPPILESPQGGRVQIGGRWLINLASNNYLGLANDPRLKQAAIEAVETWGAGAGAVRWLGGTNLLYEQLEHKLAEFKKTEAVLVFQSGFNANSGTIPSCFGEGDVIISDELNHASIIDGVRLSAAKYKKSEGYVYEHKDMNHLEDILKRCGHFKKRLIVTDGVFSMDGDIAPLPEIVALAERYDAVVMVDDAHASGVLGEHGSGTTSHFGLYGRVDIQLGTLSKAIGVIGGYIAGSHLLKEWLINRGRPYLFSTALPPAAVGAILKAIEILMTDPEPMRRLWENARYWKENLHRLGFDTMGSETPITPVYCGEEAIAQQMEARLREEGVFTLGIVYPMPYPAQSARAEWAMKARVNFIRDLLVRNYEGSQWHSFKAAVRDLTEEEALWVPPTGYKGYRWADGTILKIIFHLGADKLVQISSAFGEGGVDWHAMEVRFRAMGNNLTAALQIAHEGYETTLDALAPLTDEDLEVERPYWGGGRMATGDLFLMLAEHDVYHAGQIVYIRGLYAAQRGK